MRMKIFSLFLLFSLIDVNANATDGKNETLSAADKIRLRRQGKVVVTDATPLSPLSLSLSLNGESPMDKGPFEDLLLKTKNLPKEIEVANSDPSHNVKPQINENSPSSSLNFLLSNNSAFTHPSSIIIPTKKDEPPNLIYIGLNANAADSKDVTLSPADKIRLRRRAKAEETGSSPLSSSSLLGSPSGVSPMGKGAPLNSSSTAKKLSLDSASLEQDVPSITPITLETLVNKLERSRQQFEENNEQYQKNRELGKQRMEEVRKKIEQTKLDLPPFLRSERTKKDPSSLFDILRSGNSGSFRSSPILPLKEEKSQPKNSILPMPTTAFVPPLNQDVLSHIAWSERTIDLRKTMRLVCRLWNDGARNVLSLENQAHMFCRLQNRQDFFALTPLSINAIEVNFQGFNGGDLAVVVKGLPDLAYLRIHSIGQHVLQLNISSLSKATNLSSLGICWGSIAGFNTLFLPHLKTLALYVCDCSDVIPHLTNFTSLTDIQIGTIRDKTVRWDNPSTRGYLGHYSHLTALNQLRVLNLDFGVSQERSGYEKEKKLDPFPSLVLLTQLKHLTLNSTYVTTNVQFSHLTFLDSLKFNTSHTNIVTHENEDLERIASLTQLHSLELFSGHLKYKIPDVLVKPQNFDFLERLINLRHLCIGIDVPRENQLHMFNVIKTLPCLTSLQLRRIFNLEPLNTMTMLRELGLYECSSNSADLKHISNLNDLEVLKLGAIRKYDHFNMGKQMTISEPNIDFVDSKTFKYLKCFKKLRELYLFLNGGTCLLPVELLPPTLSKLYYENIDRMAQLQVTLLRSPQHIMYDTLNLKVYRVEDHDRV